MADTVNDTAYMQRKRRIRMYKRIIVLFLLFLILLPTVFCVILFVRVGKLQKQLNTLMAIRLAETEMNDNSAVSQPPDIPDYIFAQETESSSQETEPEQDESTSAETPEISDKLGDSTVSFSPAEGIYGAYSEDMIEAALAEGRKVVYLTFDDGPSSNTERILDVLDEYNVKATFFTIGKTGEEYENLYHEIVDNGHTLGMHSYSHQYDNIYKTIEAFDEDFEKISSYLEEITGSVPKFYRFPGGTSNLVSAIPMTNFIKYLNDKGIIYFDWNVSAQDAEGKMLPVETLLGNIFKDVEKKDVCVILMHDADNLDTTVDMLPELIERLIEMDAVILPITENTTLIQHIAADSVQ